MKKNLCYSEKYMSHQTHPSLTKSIQSGIIAGFLATVIGNSLGVITHGIAGTYYLETSVSAVTVGAMSFGVIAALFYHFFRQMTNYSRDFLSIIGLTLPTLVSIYVLTNNYYDTAFKIIATSIVYAVVLTTVILVPWLEQRAARHAAAQSKKK